MTVLIVIWTAILVLGLLYFSWTWDRILSDSLPAHGDLEQHPQVSVLVPFRNEWPHILHCAECLRSQDYPCENLEIFLIDDHSEDLNQERISQLQQGGIQVLHLPAEQSGKKAALRWGAERSRSAYLLQTDADCGMGSRWVSEMIKEAEMRKLDLVCGRVVPHAENAGWLERFQYGDFLGLMWLSQVGLESGRMALGSAANMLYRRELFGGNDEERSGDDIFLIERALLMERKMGFCRARDARVWTQAEDSWSGLFCQRLRWAEKSWKYRHWGLLFLMVGYGLYYWSILAFLAVGLWQASIAVMGMVLAFGLIGHHAYFLTRSYDDHATDWSPWELFLFTLTHLFFSLTVSLGALSGKRVLWKGRR